MKIRKIRPQDVFSLSPRNHSRCLSLYATDSRDLEDRLAEMGSRLVNESADESTLRLFRSVQSLASDLAWTGSGLGIFASQLGSGYAVLPFKTRSLAIVADSFHVKPLLKWMQRERPFFAVRLLGNQALVYEGSLTQLRRIFEMEPSQTQRFRNPWRMLARRVDQLVRHTAYPVVLLGPSKLTSRLQGLLNHSECLTAIEPSNADDATLTEIHQATLRALEPFWVDRENQLTQRYWEQKALRRTSANLNEIVRLTLEGQVAHLFVNETTHVWGSIADHPPTLRYSPGPIGEGDDVLDDLAESVLFHRGTVTVLPSDRMPESKAAAAILKRRAPRTASTLIHEPLPHPWHPGTRPIVG